MKLRIDAKELNIKKANINLKMLDFNMKMKTNFKFINLNIKVEK